MIFSRLGLEAARSGWPRISLVRTRWCRFAGIDGAMARIAMQHVQSPWKSQLSQELPTAASDG